MIQLIMDQDTGRSKGYGFITYGEAEDAKKALEQVSQTFDFIPNFIHAESVLVHGSLINLLSLMINCLLMQMNGFELAGRAMKVGHVTDRTDGTLGGMGGQGGM